MHWMRTLGVVGLSINMTSLACAYTHCRLRVCAINENDEAHDIGIENTLKMTDDQVRAYLAQICEQEGLNPNLKELPREKRNYVLFKAFEAGIGVRQLSRITFIAHSTIHRLSLLAKER